MEGVHLSALALLVLFGTNWVLWGCLWLHERFSHKACHGSGVGASGAIIAHTGQDGSQNSSVAQGERGKVLSEPLSRSLRSVRAFSRELARLGAIVTFAYMCENHPLFPHMKKEHDMDMFWCMALVLFLSSMLNVRKSKGGDVLNREQTEEWKGWMQFMFLMYHYFSAHEVYNSIRVFITAYVWMTGFGNFSFFYLKGDYSAVRLLQMLWRLNFLVSFLCMAMGNTYILYYICPLHTFYFLVVYSIMRPVRSANYSKNGIRYKMLIAGLIIFCVWDLDIQLFDKIFFFLGRKKVIGAGFGTLWEWYFRSSLDHWSTFLGMIFALNYPATSLWVKKVEAMPPARQWLIKGFAAVVLLLATGVWATRILPLEKYDYNQKNAYFGVAIPVLTFIYLRNLSPLMRTRYLEPLHSLGKITLETYLMQHHVWLTSNAKTLLVLIPGYSKLNLVVVGFMYLLVSRELYRLTMSLRGMCLPDNLTACLRNLGGIAAAFATSFAIAGGLKALGAGPVACVFVVGILGFTVTLVVHFLLCSKKDGGSGSDTLSISLGVSGTDGGSRTGSSREYDGRLLNFFHTGPMLFVVVLLLAGASTWSPSATSVTQNAMGPNDLCAEAANHGMWKVESGACQVSEKGGAYCNSHEWKWLDVPDQCQFHYVPPVEVKKILSGRHTVIVGDSVERYIYYALIRSLGFNTPMAHNASVERHTDLPWTSSDGSGTTISFLWAVKVDDLAKKVSAVYDEGEFDVLLMGGGLWDALEIHEIDAYQRGIKELKNVVKTRSVDAPKDSITMWISMTEVASDRLTDEAKRLWMTGPKLQQYRKVVESSGLLSTVDAVVDGLELTRNQRGESYDGVHYTDLVYDAFAQVTINLVLHFDRMAPSTESDVDIITDKKITGMGSTSLGIMVLFLASVMILTRDAFLGVPRLALTLFGGQHYDRESMNWENTYGDLLRKIGKHWDGTNNAPMGSSSSTPGGKVGGSAFIGHRAVTGSSCDVIEEAESLLMQDMGENGTGLGLELKQTGLGGRK